jgi:hypothetical protein
MIVGRAGRDHLTERAPQHQKKDPRKSTLIRCDPR